MCGVLLIPLRLWRFSKLLSFQPMGAKINTEHFWKSNVICSLKPIFSVVWPLKISTSVNTLAQPKKIHVCTLKSSSSFLFFILVVTVELIYAEVIKTSCFKKKTIIVTNVAHLPSCNCVSSFLVSFHHKRIYSIFL